MQAVLPRRGPRPIWLALLVLPGCGSAPADDRRPAGVRVVEAPSPPPSPSAIARVAVDHAHQPAAAPAPAASLPVSLTDMRAHKTFTDPPLPPELQRFRQSDAQSDAMPPGSVQDDR